MLNVKVETRGEKSTLKLITSLKELDFKKIGEVYSAGAVQRGRRYEFFVMGHGTQAAIHEGRWDTNKKIAEANERYAVQQFNKLVDAFLGGRGVVTSYMRDVIDNIYRATQIYPPTLPNQKYVRTNTLKTSWRKEMFI